MAEAEIVSALIAEIYDTALDVTSWQEVLAKLCTFVPGCASNLFSQDARCSIAEIHFSWGDDPKYVQLYLEKYIKMNPFFPAAAFDEVGRVAVQSDIVPFDEFHESRFYHEWAKPQGYVDCLYCVLEKSQFGSAMITVRRNQAGGLVDDEARRRMNLLVPHIRRAVLISRALEHSKAQSGDLHELLGHISAGIFLLTDRAGIAYANEAGEKLILQNDAIASRAGKLTALDPSTDAVLSSTLSELQQGSASPGVGGIAIPIIGKSGQRYVAHVLPMTSGLRRRMAMQYSAVAAVFIRKAGLTWASPVETVAKLYKLTASEVRVLLAVAEQGGYSEIASALGLSEDTVKTHLRHIYQKTGTRRQPDLVRLLAEFASAAP